MDILKGLRPPFIKISTKWKKIYFQNKSEREINKSRSYPFPPAQFFKHLFLSCFFHCYFSFWLLHISTHRETWTSLNFFESICEFELFFPGKVRVRVDKRRQVYKIMKFQLTSCLIWKFKGSWTFLCCFIIKSTNMVITSLVFEDILAKSSLQLPRNDGLQERLCTCIISVQTTYCYQILKGTHKPKAQKSKSYPMLLEFDRRKVQKLIHTGRISELVREPNLTQPIQWKRHKRQTSESFISRFTLQESRKREMNEPAAEKASWKKVRLNILLFYLRGRPVLWMLSQVKWMVICFFSQNVSHSGYKLKSIM